MTYLSDMLVIQKWTFNPFQENTYGIHNGEGDAVIVDPGMMHTHECAEVAGWLEKKGEKSKAIWLTHGHIDHVLGGAFLFDHFQLIPRIHEADLVTWQSSLLASQAYGIPYEEGPKPTTDLHEGQILKIGNDELKVLFLPGHAPGHVAFYSEESDWIVAGDVLFQQSVGRTDLPGGNEDTLRESIEKMYASLSEQTTVYSGHGGETSIGAEKRSNPFVNAEGSGLFQRK